MSDTDRAAAHTDTPTNLELYAVWKKAPSHAAFDAVARHVLANLHRFRVALDVPCPNVDLDVCAGCGGTLDSRCTYGVTGTAGRFHQQCLPMLQISANTIGIEGRVRNLTPDWDYDPVRSEDAREIAARAAGLSREEGEE